MTNKFPGEDTARNAVRVWSLVKSIKVAMMTTAGTSQSGASESVWNARPMRSLFEEPANAIWFIVKRDSAVLEEGTHSVLLTYSSGDHGDHVALYGKLMTVNDHAKLETLWNGHADIAFPKGPADAAACLMRFEPEKAEFWADGSDMISFVINFLEAKITGHAPTVGTHATVPANS